jgi:hypothetical protein
MAEGRSALPRRVKEDPVLQTVIYQSGQARAGTLGSYQIDELIPTCSAEESDSATFNAKRTSIGNALGPDLLNMLKVA